ncbi:MAG: hypothetical protein F9K29_20640 [Hyphomicrobiaceae bacterium]|nr:MAG: hypothetical protein F9K29_20640 [Hyphomicrobiaceae bacterium]
MTVFRTMLATFLVTLGVLIGAFAWGGYFEPSRERAALARIEAKKEPQINRAQVRTRFVAADSDSAREGRKTGPKTPVATIAAPRSFAARSSGSAIATAKVAQAAPRAPVKKVQAAPKEKDKKEAQQAAAFQWPWNFFKN